MIAPAARPGPHPRQPPHRRHCTFSTGADAAFCNVDGAVIGAAPAGTAKDDVPTVIAATARSLKGTFMTKSPLFLVGAAGQDSPGTTVRHRGNHHTYAAFRVPCCRTRQACSHRRVIGRYGCAARA